MALKYHPDKNGNTEESKTTFQKLQHIYTVLSNPEKRSKYDDLGYYRDEDEDGDYDDDDFCCGDDSEDVTRMSYDEIKRVLESVMKQMKLDPAKMSEAMDKNKSSMRYKPTENGGKDWSVSTVEKEVQRIDKLGKIYHVYWTKRGITKLPGKIPSGSKFGCVEKLFLDKNSIESLPSGFFQPLCNLSVLSLEQNRLTAIPECIFSLTGLKELNLSYNRIEEIPEGIGKLEKLGVLNLFANRLTTVPTALCGMESLVELDLDCNDIVEVPPSLRERKNLIIHLPMSFEGALTCLPPKKKMKTTTKKETPKKKQVKKRK